MHVIVLGAGVIGVTTAYYLARFGHRGFTAASAADSWCQAKNGSMVR